MQPSSRPNHLRRPARVAVTCLTALALQGCVVVVGSPLGLMGGGRSDLEAVTVDGDGRDKILLLDVSGVISDRPERRAFGLVEAESLVARVEAELQKAADESRLRALVVHVRSPGGGVTASDDVYRAIRRFAEEEEVPVVAALGGIATSGGYYVACAADHIVAHPTSVTGSIGVIMVNLNLTGLLEKLGVQDATVKAGRHKDMLSPLRPLDPSERAIAEGVLATLRERFLEVVRERRRGLDSETLAAVTDGRILDANTAVETGLADEVGDLHGAMDVARRLADTPEARVIRYRRRGEAAETIHAARIARTERSLGTWSGLAEHLETAGPRFLYLWAPPARLTDFAMPR